MVVAKVNEPHVKHKTFLPKVESLLTEFSDLMPDEFSSILSPMREIQHAMDLVLGAIPPIWQPIR